MMVYTAKSGPTSLNLVCMLIWHLRHCVQPVLALRELLGLIKMTE